MHPSFAKGSSSVEFLRRVVGREHQGTSIYHKLSYTIVHYMWLAYSLPQSGKDLPIPPKPTIPNRFDTPGDTPTASKQTRRPSE